MMLGICILDMVKLLIMYTLAACVFSWQGIYHSPLQQTFQVVLATDSRSTFAIFLYDAPHIVRDIVATDMAVVGFDAGDQQRSEAVGPDFMFMRLNVFRLDGECGNISQSRVWTTA